MKRTIPQLLQQITSDYPVTPAQYIKDDEGTFHPRSYSELYDEVLAVARGLQTLGVARGDHVGLISENRAEWLACDLAILSLGAADVPRGNDSMPGELRYILDFSGCRLVIVENAVQLAKLAGVLGELPAVKTIIVLDPHYDPQVLESGARAALERVRVMRYAEVSESGRAEVAASGAEAVETEIAKGKADDTATIIFTSGTTGTPKGVVLSHHNFLHQVGCIPDVIDINPGDIWLAVLPVWHSFERIMQYLALGSASALAYSKPVGKIMLADFAAVRPHWMGSVPRIWESVRSGIVKKVRAEGGVKWALFRFFTAVGGAHKHADDLVRGRVPDFKPRSRTLDAVVGILPWLLLKPLAALGSALVFGKIKARLGGRFVAGISGGGALPSAVDQFFGAAGILLLEGYGLTETAPVLAVRTQHRPVPGTVGQLISETQCEIRDENGRVLPPGEQGVVFVRGPQVMSGYYNAPEQTAEVLSSDGWLDTGDLGMLTHSGELKITGRAKDTIVLRGGENIEPLPIEQKLRESELIDQAVVLGQDQKFLAALIVPNEEALREALREHAEQRAGRHAGSHTVVAGGAASAAPEAADDLAALIRRAEARSIIEAEVGDLVSAKHGFRGFEQIFRVLLVADQFEIGRELSAKQEVKRHVIRETYAAEIERLFE
ncbi:MAG: AMP-dependent synthetase/ligase [Spirochaetaceae bacterium]